MDNISKQIKELEEKAQKFDELKASLDSKIEEMELKYQRNLII